MSEPNKKLKKCTCSYVGEMFFDPDDENSPDQCMKCGGVVNIKKIEPLRTELILRK